MSRARNIANLHTLGVSDFALGDTALTGAKRVTFTAEYDNGSSGVSKTITLSNGQKQKVTLSANTTLTLDLTGAATGDYQIRLIQDATGSRTVTWSGIGSSQWLNSTSAPLLNGTANSSTVVNLFVAAGVMVCASSAKVGAA